MSKVPYTIMLPTKYGNMFVNRNDINQTNALLKTGEAVDGLKVDFAVRVCSASAENSIALDIGANFGTYSLAMAKALEGKGGKVYSFEAQRIIFYMLCGSIVVNSIENCFPYFNCVGNSNEPVDIPKFNYWESMNFGSIEFGEGQQSEPLSQQRGESTEKVPQISIDELNLERIVYMKIDVEGMELSVLNGALKSIETSKPVIQIEVLKTNPRNIVNFLRPFGYKIYIIEGDLICIPKHLDSVYNFS